MPVPKQQIGSVPVTHVIFDMDGLLLDTESKYDKAIEKVCQKYGLEFSQKARKDVFGQAMIDHGEYLIKNCGLPISAEEFVREVEAIYLEIFKQEKVSLMPGAKHLVEHLYKHNVPICVATGSTTSAFELKSAYHIDLFKKFSHIVKGPDDPEVTGGKPKPDIFLVAAKRFPSPPSSMQNCLVFEDSTNGVKAARNAGMKSVWIAPSGFDTSLENPSLLLSSLEEFDPAIFGLPPYTK